jgi:hypothetical protein
MMDAPTAGGNWFKSLKSSAGVKTGIAYIRGIIALW